MNAADAQVYSRVLLPERKELAENADLAGGVSLGLVRWFTWYCRRYLRRHFHSVRVSSQGLPTRCDGVPLVVYLNHASWWDPITCVLLKHEFFRHRLGFAPIDAAMLERYRFFKRIGFFGIETGTRRGAAQFLKRSRMILGKSNNHVLFVTPQSRFADARERPVRFARGLGHLATRVERAVFLPLAVEYVFWEERLPEVLVRFGDPIECRSNGSDLLDVQNWTQLLERRLEETQDALASEVQLREAANFRVLLRGTAGVTGFYDLWRGLRAKLRGEPYYREHGTK